MAKKILKLLIIILMIIGIYFGISITLKRQVPGNTAKKAEVNIYNMIQTKSAEATSFYTYGRSFNISGKISNISKDNLENAKLVITDGLDFQEAYPLNYSFEENNMVFVSDKDINAGIVLDKLENSEYYILLRLKLNNSVDPRYYSFTNASSEENINYYTITKDGINKKAQIAFTDKKHNNKDYKLLTINVEEMSLPEEVYDIVIDAGHGGKDQGERVGKNTEANITLDYAKKLKESLEVKGYKVKLTRDDMNTGTYTYTNMYDSNGRISIACSSRAKLMISLHVNNGANNLNGFEIYCPPNSKLDFAREMAEKIKENSNINYSNNESFKISDGIYVKNYTNRLISEHKTASKKNNLEPYNVTTSTPYLYTIREVGGLATGAYVDGRNTDYSKNEYYNSNQGIECYQLELGYIKNDLNDILNDEERLVEAITETISNNF